MNKKNKEGISIIIPCYNVENYIKICLENLENKLQNFDYEIILVDDCSTDNTKEIIKNIIKSKKITFLENEENLGAGYSRNLALQKAKYDYISFIDADDFIDDNFYDEMIRQMKKEKADVIVCDIKCIYEDGTPSVVAPGCEGKISKLNIINTGFAASPCNKIFKKDLLLKYPFVEGIMNEDIASAIAIVANADKISYTNKTKYNYIQHSSSIQNSPLSMKRFDLFKSVDVLENRIKDNKEYNLIMQAVTYQQIFLFFIFVLPREKNLFKRAKYLRVFRKKSQKYHLENNELCQENLKRRGKKATFYYSLIFKINNIGLSFLCSTIMGLFQIYHSIKYSKLVGNKISVIKSKITLNDVIMQAKKQSHMKSDEISVSVVIPNYNYEKFLYERIYSVLYQNYKINELIILDDCSTDNSRAVIDELVEKIRHYVNVKKVYNETNSGTAFKQWEKGFSYATSDYVWIAEADDYCEKKLLSSLIKPIKENSDIMISYADTTFIDTIGIKQLKTIKPEIDILKTGHWNSDFVNNGIDEIKQYSYLNCTIANVSSCIIKNGNYKEYFKESGKYKQAGDWLFYLNVMKDGKIAFKNKPLNYYRVHGNNVTSTTKKEKHLEEIKRIHEENIKRYKLGKNHKKEMEKRIKFLEKVWDLNR